MRTWLTSTWVNTCSVQNDAQSLGTKRSEKIWYPTITWKFSAWSWGYSVLILDWQINLNSLDQETFGEQIWRKALFWEPHDQTCIFCTIEERPVYWLGDSVSRLVFCSKSLNFVIRRTLLIKTPLWKITGCFGSTNSIGWLKRVRLD